MEKDFEEYQRLYALYFQEPFNKAFYIQWLRQTPNISLRSANIFENYILNSKEYRQRIYNDVHRIYSKLIDTNMQENVFAEFMTVYGGQVGRVLIDDKLIESFIRSLPVFSQKYTSVISQIYKYVNDTPITQDILDTYLSTFKNNVEYTIDQLNDDILKGRLSVSTNANKDVNIVAKIKNKWNELHKGMPSSNDINTVLARLGSHDDILQALIMSYNVYNNRFATYLESEFDTINGRPMHVKEFLKYYPLLSNTPHNELSDKLQIIHNKYVHDRDIVADLYKKYTRYQIKEREFIEKYLYVVDNAQYSDIVIDELTHKLEYRSEMYGVIRKIYSNLFGTTIVEDDLEYTFEIIQQNKCELSSPSITELVSGIKKETDEFLQRMTSIFDKLLQRTPDENEQVLYKKKYRDEHDVSGTDDAIYEIIYNSLEYHDILKQHIRRVYKKHTNKDPMPSTLFNVLQKALSASGDVIRNLDKLAEFVKDMVPPSLSLQTTVDKAAAVPTVKPKIDSKVAVVPKVKPTSDSEAAALADDRRSQTSSDSRTTAALADSQRLQPTVDSGAAALADDRRSQTSSDKVADNA